MGFRMQQKCTLADLATEFLSILSQLIGLTSYLDGRLAD